jgi:phosphatidylglycerophosphatase A
MGSAMIEQVAVWVVTMWPVGYLPMPGSCASLVTLIMIIFCQPYSMSLYFAFVAGITVAAFFLVDYVLKKNIFFSSDPAEIVIDEMVGMLIIFVGISCSVGFAIIGFLLFRLLDIVKPFGIKHLEGYAGALGVLSDDIAAGFLGNIVLRIALYITS